MKPALFGRDDVVFYGGDLGRAAYYIRSGIVEIMDFNSNTVFRELKPGSSFGEIAFFLNRRRICGARCLTFVETYKLPRK